MFFWIAMCYNLSKSMFVREVKKCLAQKIAIFIVGIISVVSLFACQKPTLINQMYQILRKHKNRS